MRRVLLSITLMCALVSFGAFAVEKAAIGKKTIGVVFDNGVTESLDARKAKAYTQVGNWMENDLMRVIARYAKKGYEGKLLGEKNDFKSGENNYLLKVKITNYSSGSKAARMFVGYGAGGVKLDIHYELYAGGEKPIVANDDGVYSGRSWVNAARKLNENMIKDVVEQTGK